MKLIQFPYDAGMISIPANQITVLQWLPDSRDPETAVLVIQTATATWRLGYDTPHVVSAYNDLLGLIQSPEGTGVYKLWYEVLLHNQREVDRQLYNTAYLYAKRTFAVGSDSDEDACWFAEWICTNPSSTEARKVMRLAKQLLPHIPPR